MIQTIIYDLNGDLRGVQQRNDDGALIFGPLGSDFWNAYTTLNGVPPLKGVPTFPPDPLPANIQSAITAFKQFKSATTTQQNALTGAQIGGLMSAIIDCFNYINRQLVNS